MSAKRIRASAIVAAGAALLIAALPSQAFAHEDRVVGPYKFVVGFRAEPAFEKEPNAADIFISRASDGRPINRDNGDTVNLTIEVQLRDSETFNSRIRVSAELTDTLRQAFGTPNRYNKWFKPDVAGTYAFRFRGLVSDTSDPKAGPLTVDQTFVCGKGTLSPDGDGFGCVAVPQLFPGREFGDPRAETTPDIAADALVGTVLLDDGEH